ncbi:hypothetical protein BDB01DRAFT_772148 [Pilobolus umbonatus]|nr:hypothetical protein BDB01DRAFT_772148 [Pilobolus umbonatus]
MWIPIQPGDTGKVLAERIHELASHRSRKVAKIITRKGRSVPLDNRPVFEDWDEILSHKEGEEWKVEWVPMESYVDKISEGMKQLKTNFKSH